MANKAIHTRQKWVHRLPRAVAPMLAKPLQGVRLPKKPRPRGGPAR